MEQPSQLFASNPRCTCHRFLCQHALMNYFKATFLGAVFIYACQNTCERNHSSHSLPLPNTQTQGTELVSPEWPESLAPFGDGFPNPGDPCRRLGESARTSPYLDHSKTLVGCPGTAASPHVRTLLTETSGTVVGHESGFVILSLPLHP